MMQFYGNLLPKTAQEKHPFESICQRIALHKGAGTELILKCIHIGA